MLCNDFEKLDAIFEFQEYSIQEDLPKPKELLSVSEDHIEHLIGKMVRYLVYKSSTLSTIVYNEIGKLLYPKYRGITKYCFIQGCIRVKRIFGYLIVPAAFGWQRRGNATGRKLKLNAKLAETYYAMNVHYKDTKHMESILAQSNGNHDVHYSFMMGVLGILWCLPDHSSTEDTLLQYLSQIDPLIVSWNSKHPVLGHIGARFKQLNVNGYLLLKDASETNSDGKKVKSYTYGPRVYVEITIPQVLSFVHMVLHQRLPPLGLYAELKAKSS